MNHFDHETDELELLQGIRNDRIEAFEEIFRRYVKRFYFFCFGILKEEDAASETVTHIFKKIWDERQVVPEGTLEMYIFKLACQEVCLVLKEGQVRKKGQVGQQIGEERTARSFFNRLLARFFYSKRSAGQLAELKECKS